MVVLICKNNLVLDSPKYAIVRKNILDFEIYDAKDNISRSFSEKENLQLKDVVISIINDNPVNMIHNICYKKLNVTESLEWLKTQPISTIEFVKNHRIDIKYNKLSINNIIKNFNLIQYEYLEILNNLEYDDIKLIAEKLCKTHIKNHKFTEFKIAVFNKLKKDDKLIYLNDKDPNIKCYAIPYASESTCQKLLNHRNIIIIRKVAKYNKLEFLLKTLKSTKSIFRKQVILSEINNRIDQSKLNEFILSQPVDVIKSLLK